MDKVAAFLRGPQNNVSKEQLEKAAFDAVSAHFKLANWAAVGRGMLGGVKSFGKNLVGAGQMAGKSFASGRQAGGLLSGLNQGAKTFLSHKAPQTALGLAAAGAGGMALGRMTAPNQQQQQPRPQMQFNPQMLAM